MEKVKIRISEDQIEHITETLSGFGYNTFRSNRFGSTGSDFCIMHIIDEFWDPDKSEIYVEIWNNTMLEDERVKNFFVELLI